MFDNINFIIVYVYMEAKSMHKKWRKLVASTLVMTMLISTVSYLAPVKTVEALVNNSGNAPYINTWMVAGPSQTPTAEQIYSGISGDELIRPTDGNWAKLAIASISLASIAIHSEIVKILSA